MASAQSVFGRGARVEVSGLEKRADLNAAHATVLTWVKEVRRWTIRVEPSGEVVRVKPINLKLLTPACGPIVETAEEDEPIVLQREGGQALAVYPEKAKRRFEEVSQKYVLSEHTERVTEFFFAASSGRRLTADAFAREFETSEIDAGDFMAWVEVSLAFKDQHMQAPPAAAQR
ncbi:hypothetical protein KFE25_003478 [Diacronema lutheri]|uniref:Uncharacterized protein n=1 Tax=Diacronema lutheri TaxID=2081491 RepID=A0A8J5XJ89_DIALT|nr:hypothetical protein KFE25_003478 [Diacronema lutheri]